VFTLRQGVKFQDGTDFNAEAVKFNIDRYIHDAQGRRASELASVDTVEAKDAQTAIFHLKRADGTLLAQLVDRAGMILSPTAVKQLGANLTVNATGAGTGPFQFVEWKRDDHLTLKRNPSYWAKDKSGHQLPYLDQLVFRPMTDQNAILASLKTGDVDFARTVAFKDVATVRSDANLVYRDTPGLNFQSIEINHSVPPFNDPAKAKALAMAIDRSQILKNVVYGIGVVSHGPLAPSSWAFDPSEKAYDKQDLQGAKQTATGFTFELRTANVQDSEQIGQLIQAELSKAGITVNLVPEDFGKLNTELHLHQFVAALSGWSGRIDPDGNTYAFFHTGGSFNDGLYSNKQVDTLLEQARASTDQTMRKQLYQQAQKLIVDEVGDVFLYHTPVPQISSNKVQNFPLIPDGINRFAGVWKS
jgi:peptide/nickel transport system substrate-binding protein